MTEVLREFGRRMDTAVDKQEFIDYAKDCMYVLDLGAGTGKMARELSSKWHVHVDAVDQQFKGDCLDQNGVTYYGTGIIDFLTLCTNKQYNCIILSAILHELSNFELAKLSILLPKVMAPNCRILIREPFYDNYFGPVDNKNREKLGVIINSVVPEEKQIEYRKATKLSTNSPCPEDWGREAVDWLNLAFTYSYGEENWSREIHEYRYARSLNWCKDFFNFDVRPYTGFEVICRKDEAYRKHFADIGYPEDVFNMLRYTGMTVLFDYKAVD